MNKYILLMKLRVVELLLVTTVPALFLASNGIPRVSITFWSLIGGTLAAGGANAFNMVIESKSDQLMKRTANRPIATGEISKLNGLLFAFLISILSLVIFYVFTTVLATLLTATAIIFYVIGYTMMLKNRTSQNIVWGGIAGCMPVLIGQSAVTNTLTLTSWLFFLLIFFWTPPHFWALAVRYKDDYTAASIPMLPVVAPMKSVINQMWLHSTLMAVISVLVITTAKLPIWTLVLSVLLIIGWKIQLIKLTKEPTEVNAGKLFQASIIFLSIYSFLLVIGVLLK
ncbi:MAG: protoheme IX farnesyltransferase [Actinobacteria bacterium]|uniref:Protoheme IX farnesyltransferase n=1 Tax=freshwater metagenome TaxID=449393 RepID=A0A6J6UHY5_9ZZZZ|nr:protoheme IX farnesyltransferase [Actinomycetota bacterium]